jgi:uncharacterized membrane-anchored protein YjiN (DUF445 family)
MVGALADWFAVVALFRRPLGLPIPHTAIIPENKDRIGGSIANFLEHNFMTHDILKEEFKDVDFADVAATWLSDPANSRAVAAQIANIVPALLHMTEEDDIARLLQRTVASTIERINFSPILAEVLSALVARRQHQAVFDRIIAGAAHALEQNKPYIREKVHEQSPRWMPKAIDEKFFERLIDGVQSMLDEMQEENSEWRMRFQIAVEELIEKLRSSPDYEERIASAVRHGLAHPLLREYLGYLWQDVKQRIYADAQSSDSQAIAKLDEAIRFFGKVLRQDDKVRQKLNDWLRDFAIAAIVARRAMIASIVERVIRRWDSDTISRKFELHVGKDLQYIRINGTLVGGTVGLILHAISLVL